MTLTVSGYASFATPSSTWFIGFDHEGRYTATGDTKYRFVVDNSVMIHGGIPDTTYERNSYHEVWSGSTLYIPLGMSVDGEDDVPVTDKVVKNADLVVSYTAIDGKDCIEYVELVNGKKEKIGKNKIPELGSNTYAKIQFSDTYLPLSRTRVGVRLVLSVHGISYQQTAVTFRCYMQNRVELITRNSVYGALTPSQFHAVSYSGEATFDFGDGIRYTGRVAARDRYYLNLDKAVEPALTEMYPDAYIEGYSFWGNNDTFPASGKLEIPITEAKFREKKTKAEVYVYTIKGNTLRAVSLNLVSYNHLTQTVTINTATLDNYIFSSRALLKNVDKDQFDILRSGYADNTVDEDLLDEPSVASAR